jgi:hypothetical protein
MKYPASLRLNQASVLVDLSLVSSIFRGFNDVFGGASLQRQKKEHRDTEIEPLSEKY